MTTVEHHPGGKLRILRSQANIQVVAPHDGPDSWPYRTFKSSPWTPVNLTVTTDHGGLADGYLFFTPKSRNSTAIHQQLGLIMSSDNEIVYALNESLGLNDLRVQQVHGEPHLTFWRGRSVKGYGYGEFVALNQHYEEKVLLSPTLDVHSVLPKTVQAPAMLDFHEHKVTPWNTVLVSAYNNTPANLSEYGGPERGWIVDSLIFELDLTTQEVLSTWSALQHLKVEDSRLPLPSHLSDGSFKHPYDFFHINSVDTIDENTLLVNSRHMWAFYLISRHTGDVLWELNGGGETRGNFGILSENDQFRWQHDARAYNVTKSGMTISIFDNHNTEDDTDKVESRGLMVAIELPPQKSVKPKIVRHVLHSDGDKIFAQGQGCYDPCLENGNQLIGHGPIPVVQEFSRDGKLLWEGRFGGNNKAQSYRTFKQKWHAVPHGWGPSLALEQAGQLQVAGGEADPNEAQIVGYVSWNGATDIEAWNVYQTRDNVTETIIGAAPKVGFETVFHLPLSFFDLDAEAKKAIPELGVNGSICIFVSAVQGSQEIRRSNTACISMDFST
ncbi:ASST-domain-containing protein [Stachybotrys elegans]|uniref:ASST-domain-containing protein n=1 Tax=Stachybotrys elegans TaxID=80388 RepID=A0A8K0SDI1_9HYPO|nr:ASST-domain-containing protein [Stachybotrys elegans]